MKLRKILHISGVFIPIIAINMGKTKIITLIFLCIIIFLILEALKQKISKDILLLFYRKNELKGLSIEPLSYFISVLSLLYLSYFIDENICFAAIATLTAGDGVAGVIGKRYGRHKFFFNKKKSWEGTISGFIAASLYGFYFVGGIAIAGGAFGMLAGAISRNDNIVIPYSALAGMYLVRYGIEICSIIIHSTNIGVSI